jgi:hypothetical protein
LRRNLRLNSAVFWSLNGMTHLMHIVASMVLLAMVTGCRHPPGNRLELARSPSDLSTYKTPTNLANQIASADCIIVTNSNFPQYAGFSLVLSGNKAKELVQDISSARCYTLQTDPGWLPDWELQFYKGTIYLASVPFVGDGFIGDGGKQQWPMRQSYNDQSGTLGKIYEDVTRTIPSKAK